MGGLISTTGWKDGPPIRTETAIADVLAGIFLTIGVLAAYVKSKESGVGQVVDIALVDSIVAALEIINQIYLASGRIPERIGNRYESVYPYDSFRAKDGYLVIACGNDKLFGLLANIMKRPDLISDPLFQSNALRVQNHAQLKPILEEWLTDKTIDETVDILVDFKKSKLLLS